MSLNEIFSFDRCFFRGIKMPDQINDTINTNTRSPKFISGPLSVIDSLESACVSHTLSARNVRINNHGWNFRGAVSPKVFIIARLSQKTGSDGIFLSYKVAEIEKLATHRNSSDPLSTPALIFNACAARFVCASHPAIDCITRRTNTPKIDSPVVQSETVPMVDNLPTARGNDHIMQVDVLSVYPSRCIKSIRFGIPPRIPGVLIQLLKIRFVNKGELPLRQGDTTVWGKFGQPAQDTTPKPCEVFA